MKRPLIIGAILAGAGMLGYSIYKYFQMQAALMKQFDYKIVDFTINNLSLELIKGKISILFTSVADIEVTVQEFYLDFYFDGKRVGYLQDVSQFIIPANASTTIPFEYTLNPQLVIGNIVDILAYTVQKQDASIRVVGYAKLKSGFISASLPVSYETTLQTILKG